jgi:hypothetical protein
MSESTLVAGRGTQRVDREFLKTLPLPEATRTHQPIGHHRIVEALIETLGFRNISVVADEYAVSTDGMKMFGLLELDYEFNGVRFAIGLRNANDKSMRLALTVGYRVFVCSYMAFRGDFQPVLAKHSKSFDLIDTLSIGVDRIQRNFEPLQRTITDWQANIISPDEAKLIIYQAFVEAKLAPPRLLPSVHRYYFEPEYDEFKQATLWSLSNAFTSSFKELKAFQQYRATGKLSPFLNRFYRPF